LIWLRTNWGQGESETKNAPAAVGSDQEELRRAEQKQGRDSPALPPVSKSLLNGLARVPYGLISPLFMGS